jgi:chloride channel protein, CIC family
VFTFALFSFPSFSTAKNSNSAYMNQKFSALLININKWRRQKISNANFLLILAAVVGLLGGLAASLLKMVTHFIEDSLQNDLHWKYKYYLYLVFPLIGILLTVVYVRTFIRKDKFRHGLTPILKSISHNSGKISFHNIYSQIITSAITTGFGGSVGLEAPIVYSGSAIGSNLSRFFGLRYREVILLLACGAGAGIAGAFNSPIAGMVFALEILLPTFSIPAFIPLLISVATATVVSKTINSKPLFVLVTEGWATQALFFYVIMAFCIGYFSVYFFKLNFFIKGLFEKIKRPYHKIWIGGAAIGLMIALFPALYGEGYVTIQQLMNGNYSSLLANSFFSAYRDSPWLLILFATLTLFGKSLASLLTVSSGGNGGAFGPALVMGGFIGFIFAHSINQLGWVHLNTTNFIVVGMAAALSGIMHAPLTGIFLIAEITGGYVLMVPLMIVSAIAFFINKANTRHSIYTKALADEHAVIQSDFNDQNILKRMKLKYLLERDLVQLHPEDTPRSRSGDIIQTDQNIFPVVATDGTLAGIVYSQELLEILISKNDPAENTPIQDLLHPAMDNININTDMVEVMQKMDIENTFTFPVVSDDYEYKGFVSKKGIMNKYRALMKRDSDFMQ